MSCIPYLESSAIRDRPEAGRARAGKYRHCRGDAIPEAQVHGLVPSGKLGRNRESHPIDARQTQRVTGVGNRRDSSGTASSGADSPAVSMRTSSMPGSS